MSEARVIAEGRHLRLLSRRGWEFADRIGVSGIVVIVAVTEEDRILLVEQHREPVSARVIELPAGLAGDVAGEEDEPLAAAVRRELLEETGYEAGALSPLVSGPPSAGLSTEVVTFYLATGLRKVAAGGGAGSESIEVHEVPRARAAAWLEERIREGVLVDPKVYAGLYFAGSR